MPKEQALKTNEKSTQPAEHDSMTFPLSTPEQNKLSQRQSTWQGVKMLIHPYLGNEGTSRGFKTLFEEPSSWMVFVWGRSASQGSCISPSLALARYES